MTPAELAAIKGITVDAVTRKARRMRDDGQLNGYDGGFGKDKPLPKEVVAFYLNGSQSEPVGEKAKAEPVKANFPESPNIPKSPVKAKSQTKQTKPAPAKSEPEEVQQVKSANNGTVKEALASPPVESKQQFDLGEWVLFHPSAQFLFVVVILGAGAYIFASLAARLYPGDFTELTFCLFFGVGFLVDASGIIFAKSYQKKDRWDDAGLVHFLLAVLLIVQVWIESSYMFYDSSFTWSGLAVVLVRPLGQFIYSEMYLNQK